MTAYLVPSTSTKTDAPAQAGRGRINFFLRLLFALAGLLAVSSIAHAAVAAPVFSPVTGTYLSAQTMTLSTATSGASIAYTTDGSIPTESSGTVTHGSLYTIPLTISVTTTVQAIAFASGDTDSPVTSVTYTINSLPAVAAPVFSPGGGSYTSAQPVMITSATNGAAIRYTTDGSTPSPTAGTLFYPGSLNIGATTTLNAIAYEAGYNPSTVTNATYTITLPTPAAAPVFSPGGGTYTSVQSVTISTATGGTSIAYTTDGTTPTEVGGTITHGSLYTGAISMNTTIVLQAVAFGGGYTDSPMTSATYFINLPPPTGAPSFSYPAGTYGGIVPVTIGSLTNGASIAYTTDGSTPTESGGTVTHGTLLSNGGTITFYSTTTLKAIAFASGLSDSAVVSATYTIIQAAAPTFSPNGGNFTTDATDAYPVTITSATSGATIYYTLDGSSPLTNPSYQIANGGTAYIPGSASGNSVTLTAVAVASGNAPSNLSAASYTVTIPQTATPTFSPDSGTYTTDGTDTLSVTINTSTVGYNNSAAYIIYTTNGSTPSESGGLVTNGTLMYSGGSVQLGLGTTTLNAIAVANGYTDSVMYSTNYTLNPPQTATPSFNPPGGQVNSTQQVTISTSTVGSDGSPANIYYTTNGSSAQNGGILITSGQSVPVAPTLHAVAVARGYTPSADGFGNYILMGWIGTQATITGWNSNTPVSVSYSITDGGNTYSGSTSYGSNTNIDFFNTQIVAGPGYVLWETYAIGNNGDSNFQLIMARYVHNGHAWTVQNIDSPAAFSHYTFSTLAPDHITGTVISSSGSHSPFSYAIQHEQIAP